MTEFRAMRKDVGRIAVDNTGEHWLCSAVFDNISVFLLLKNETYHLLRNDGRIYTGETYFVRWKDDASSKSSGSSLQEIYDDVMLRDIKIRSLMEEQKRAKIKLGELIEQQGAKHADNDRTS